MTEIYLIRHAQAEGNLYRMMQGHWDGDVTELGKKQIDALAQRFKDVHIDALYTSDLYRTRLTASAITRYHDIPMNTTPLFREINVGPWETLFFGNVFHEENEQAELFIHDPDKWFVEGAETYAQVGNRAYPALEELAKKHDGQTIAVVSHGVTIRCLLSKVTGIGLSDTERLPICRNTAVSKVRWENGTFTAEYLNDYSHILPLGNSSWAKTGDLRHEPFDPAAGREWYEACYADAWCSAHGDLNGFSPSPYYEAALLHHKENKDAVLQMYLGEEPVGLLDLDTKRGAHAGYGWISLIYLKPEYRFQGYGIQILARAISLYSAMGRKALRLHAAKDNKAALAFYEKYGFEALGTENSVAGKLLLMEKKLGRRQDV